MSDVANVSLDQLSEGLYANGVWRWTERDNDGQIVRCRTATAAEVMWWESLQATHTLAESNRALIEEIRSIQTYGLRIEK